jgi:spermidine synthase
MAMQACVLIVGGGDGGMAREVLRHKSVEKVTMVEVDEGVVAFFQNLSAKPFKWRI